MHCQCLSSIYTLIFNFNQITGYQYSILYQKVYVAINFGFLVTLTMLNDLKSIQKPSKPLIGFKVSNKWRGIVISDIYLLPEPNECCYKISLISHKSLLKCHLCDCTCSLYKYYCRDVYIWKIKVCLEKNWQIVFCITVGCIKMYDYFD